jgi:alkanesulfonate monooxygenase SsuD/methylene tetrahydromethanopterin reductase-like flavin-dependent oxidoreductase (luciferase family)
VSAGGGFRNFAAFGVDRDTFVGYFTEDLELMKAAWSDAPTITVNGRFRELTEVPLAPKPVQRPHPPIWVGAAAPASIARAVRHGNGFLGAGSTTIVKFAAQVQLVCAEIETQQRTDFPIGKRVYLCVARDATAGRAQVRAGLYRLYGDLPGIQDVPVAGTAEDVLAGLHAVPDLRRRQRRIPPAPTRHRK